MPTMNPWGWTDPLGEDPITGEPLPWQYGLHAHQFWGAAVERKAKDGGSITGSHNEPPRIGDYIQDDWYEDPDPLDVPLLRRKYGPGYLQALIESMCTAYVATFVVQPSGAYVRRVGEGDGRFAFAGVDQTGPYQPWQWVWNATPADVVGNHYNSSPRLNRAVLDPPNYNWTRKYPRRIYSLSQTATWPDDGDAISYGDRARFMSAGHAWSGYCIELKNVAGVPTWEPTANPLGDMPDVKTNYGLAVPGDYNGVWLWGEIRDAFDELAWTRQIDNTGTYGEQGNKSGHGEYVLPEPGDPWAVAFGRAATAFAIDTGSTTADYQVVSIAATAPTHPFSTLTDYLAGKMYLRWRSDFASPRTAMIDHYAVANREFGMHRPGGAADWNVVWDTNGNPNAEGAHNEMRPVVVNVKGSNATDVKGPLLLDNLDQPNTATHMAAPPNYGTLDVYARGYEVHAVTIVRWNFQYGRRRAGAASGMAPLSLGQ